MSTNGRTVFLTGATGLLGGEVLARLLAANPRMRARVLVRDPAQWPHVAARLGPAASRATPVVGDMTRRGLGLPAAVWTRLTFEVDAILHFAADTRFSQSLEHARAVNVQGTRNVLELADEWPHVERVAFVSTAFVAGRRTGRIYERDNGPGTGWVNAYEQSKYEAERLVRSQRRGWVIFRPATVLYDLERDIVPQINAAHRALHIYHRGLAAMMPGTDDSPVDAVTSDYVGAAIAELALRDDTVGQTFHLCAGGEALPLGELLDTSFAGWSRSPEWRRKGIARPALTDLATYRLFERSVEETGDVRLRRLIGGLSHFVPQLALPKQFDTTCADGALGYAAPPVRSYWPRMLECLLVSGWQAASRIVERDGYAPARPCDLYPGLSQPAHAGRTRHTEPGRALA